MTNKSRDMKHAKYTRFIKGDKDKLERIALMYSDQNLILREDERYIPGVGWKRNGVYYLVIRVEMEVWNHMIKNLGLVVSNPSRQKRYWEIA